MSDMRLDEETFCKIIENTKDRARTVHVLHHPVQQMKSFFHLKVIFNIFILSVNNFYIFPFLQLGWLNSAYVNMYFQVPEVMTSIVTD